MNINFGAIEKAWFKPKKTVLDELEEYIKENTYQDIWDDSVILSKYLLDKIQELKKEVK